MIHLDGHPLAGAFLANKLDRLADMIAQQGEDLLQDAGIDIPSRAVSLLMLVGEHDLLSVADIAATIGQPHQLVTQRADILIDRALIERRGDPADGRRKTLALTAKGEAEHAKLQIMLSEAAEAFAGLFEEIQCDLSAYAMKAMEALSRASIVDRIRLQPRLRPTSRIDAQGCSV
jgi:DNA-binding MarR family transcriptional regulator